MRIFLKKTFVLWDLPRVPKVPILGPNRGMFAKLYGPGPLGSGVWMWEFSGRPEELQL